MEPITVNVNVERLKPQLKRIAPTPGIPFRLDLGCGDNKREGFLGVDIAATPSIDFQMDLTKFPWPIEDGVLDEGHCSHFFEHLTGVQRIAFMDECYRIMRRGAQIAIIVPYWSSMRAIQDPTHQWPPVCESSFLYFNKGWRDTNKLSHYGIKCDFDFTYGYSYDQDLVVRNDEFKQFATRHYIQAVNDLHVTLTRR